MSSDREKLESLMNGPIIGRVGRTKLGAKEAYSKGHYARPGTGPIGETCGTCAHMARKHLAKTYLKCGKASATWTGGPGTDIRARDAACIGWERKPPGTPGGS